MAMARRMGFLLCATAALAISVAHAEQRLIVPAGPALRAGDMFVVQLLVTNDDAQPTRVDIPDELLLRLTGERSAQNLGMVRDAGAPGGSHELPPQAFMRIDYRGRLPFDATGAVTLRAMERAIAPVMFAIGEPAQDTGAAPAQESAAATGQAVEPITPLSRESAFLSAFSAYEPVYFAVGSREDWNAKFQLSFKFRFFNDEANLVQRFHFLEHLYLGYTQTSLWDLQAPSAPFRDTSYKPRLFYSDAESWNARDFPLRLGFEFGVGHESNGRGGSESRSVNIAYVRPTLVFGKPGDWQWTFSPMFYDYVDRSDNPDIADYRGYVDLYASVGKADGWQLAALVRKGDGERWTMQLDLTYPLGGVALGNLNGYLLFQFFDGWGESILDYNHRSPAQYRLGLMFVR